MLLISLGNGCDPLLSATPKSFEFNLSAGGTY